MTSKEALKELTLMINREKHINSEWNKKIYDLELIIKKDLDKFKKLEKKNQELLVNKNVAQGIATKLKEENIKLKKVIEVFKSFKIILKDDGNELYTLKFAFDIYGLTPEEYKLLKEVFENGN